MADRISSLPDAALCYILSFLPTKEAVATSVLSKRWILLWQSVPTLDFDYSNDIHENNNESYSRFVHSVYTFILSRDLDQPLQRFYLRCGSSLCDTATVNTWLTAAAQLRVEHLSISLRRWNSLPSAIIRCKTLVVLKLTTLAVAASLCDFPLLKILHMDSVYFPQRKHLAELLSGSPNIEDLEMKNLFSSSYKKNEGNFKRLCKLLRAVIVKTEVPLEVVYNVKFLRIEEMDGEDIQDQIPEFYNLTHIEFSYLDYDEYGHDILQVLSHCPNLQYLSIDKDNNIDFSPDLHLEDCSCPQGVPECISLYLKTCRLVKYTGTRGEFEFAKYIMQNARVLQDMTICTYTTENKEEQLEMMKEKFEMIKQLSLCSRVSPSCKLSFH